MELYKNKKWLQKEYLDNGISTCQIAKEFGVNRANVVYWMKKFNIPRRKAYNVNHCHLTVREMHWLDGEMLGDGSITSQSYSSAHFCYGSKYEEYIHYISNTLDSFGIEQSGRILSYSPNGHLAFHYASRFYKELKPLRDIWYPDGKKIVPKDIELTPVTCRQWYIGDGSLRKTSVGNGSIELATYGFMPSDVEWLVGELRDWGFKAKRSNRNTINIPVESTKDFLDYIGGCPVECYQYKWDL